MKRRHVLRGLAGGAASALLATPQLRSQPTPQERQTTRGLPPAKITDVKALLTAPPGLPRTVVVKIETDQSGLYGWGCATFTQRAKLVVTAVDEFLRPFLMGKDPDAIEDIWQTMYVSSYWRNGPVLYNAGFESLAMVKLFDPDEFAAPPRLADPIAFSDSDRVRSPRTAKAKPEVIRAAMAGAGTLTEAWAQLPPEERHINTIRGLLSHALHAGADFSRDAWDGVDFEQIDGTTRTAYLPVVTLAKDSDD